MMETPVFELVVESDGWGSRRPNGRSLQEWEMDLGFLTQCGVLAEGVTEYEYRPLSVCRGFGVCEKAMAVSC